MYKREFENLLKAKNLPKASFIYGACDYQNALLTHALLEALDVQAEEKLTLYFD